MRVLLTLLLAAVITPAAARGPLRGRVADGDNPVGYATVVLLRDGRQAGGATTGSDGRFTLEADTGRYTIVVRHVAYKPLEKELHAGPGAIDLGVLRLEPAGIGAVTVTGSAITRQADRFVVSVGDTPAFAGLDAAELLAKAPGVWLSDKGISINGADGTKVLVDGRELKGPAAEIASYLHSLTSADIARIEVVPQAGAEFAADTRGGVILITLRRRRNNGIDGNLQALTSQGNLLSVYTPSARIAIRTGRWTLDASGSGSLSPRAESRYTETRSYRAAHVPFWSTSDARSRSDFGRGRFSALYDPAPHHTIGFDVEYTGRSNRIPTLADTRFGDTRSESRYRQHLSSATLTTTANYIWKIDTLGSQFKFIADYTRYTSDGDNLFHTKTTASGAARDTLYRSFTASAYDILTADAGLTLKLPHNLTLRTGLRYTRNGMRDNSRYDTRQSEAWQPQPEYGYAQRYTEQIGALYASLAATAGRWEFSAGLRGEYTAVASDALDRSYFSLFPSLTASHAFNDLRTWMLVAQWSSSIERPSFPSLNPARIQLSEYSWQSGNPALRPTYIHRLSLTLVWRYRYTLTLGGNLHRDLIREVTGTDAEHHDIIFIRPENHYSENHWFAAATVPLRLTRWWNLSLNAVGVLQRIRLDRADAPATHALLFTDATAAFTLPKGFYIEAVYRGHSRLYSGNSGVGARHTLDATLKKQFCNKRLTLFCTLSNLTDSGEEYFSRTNGMHRSFRGRTAWSGRAWKVGIVWNFRSGQKFRTRTVESAAENDRKRLSKSSGQ